MEQVTLDEFNAFLRRFKIKDKYLARLLNVTPATANKYRHGKLPIPDHARQIMETFL